MERDKETLERTKLESEINEIQLRIRDHDVKSRLEKFKVYPTYISVIATLLIAAVTFALQWSQYLDQREREQRFKVGEEMIKLVTQLDNGTSPTLQRSAALELAFFGRPAVPLLIEHLDMQANEDVQNAIVRGLAEVAQVEDDASLVIRPMATSTSRFVSQELAKQRPKQGIIQRRLGAFAEVAVLLLTQTDSELTAEVSEILKRMGGEIRENEKLDDDGKKVLLDITDSALKKLRF